jgi:hypothetical protein
MASMAPVAPAPTKNWRRDIESDVRCEADSWIAPRASMAEQCRRSASNAAVIKRANERNDAVRAIRISSRSVDDEGSILQKGTEDEKA